MNNIFGILTVVLLFSGCGCIQPKPCTVCEPTIIYKTVEKQVPIKCRSEEVLKPDYSGLNRAQKLYTEIEYRKKLEAYQESCK